MDGQLSLFDTAQKLAEELEKEQKKITVPAHTRKAKQPGVRAEMLSGLVQEIEEYIIPETDTCSKCGSKLEIVGKRMVRTEVEFVPAKLKVKQIVQQCGCCQGAGTLTKQVLEQAVYEEMVKKMRVFHLQSVQNVVALEPVRRYGEKTAVIACRGQAVRDFHAGGNGALSIIVKTSRLAEELYGILAPEHGVNLIPRKAPALKTGCRLHPSRWQRDWSSTRW